MKTLILLFSLIIGLNLMAQTNIISLKSHSGDLAQLKDETDNFGELYIPPMPVDTVKFIKNGVLVESRSNSFAMEIRDLQGNIISNREYDTIRDASITKTLSTSLKSNYSNETVFIGFEKEPTPNPHFNGMKKNGISWLFGIALVLILLNFKNFGGKIKTNASLIVLLTIASISSSTLFAQTNVISLKSHAGETKDILLEEDNFGNPPEDRIRNIQWRNSRIKQIDTVEFYRNGKIIQHYQNGLGMRDADTLVDKNYTKELTPYLQNQYQQNTVFIGFKKQKLEAAKPFFAGMKRSGFSLWIIVFIGITSITKLHRKKIVSCAKPSN